MNWTDFTPVIEHFELSNSYLASFDFLRASLHDKMANPATLETLATKFHQCFIEAVDRCIAQAQNMPYANRSNKRGEQLAAATAAAAAIQPRKAKDALPRPDSGVVMTDDGSEESGSVISGSQMVRDSVRTIRGPYRSGTGSTLPSTRALVPAQASSVVLSTGFDIPPASATTPMTVHAGSVAPPDVHIWNQDVMFPQIDVPETSRWHPADLSFPANDGGTWPQSFYDPGSNPSSTQGMDHDLNSFF